MMRIDDKEMEEAINKCPYVDRGKIGRIEYHVCLLIPPLLSSGILCPVGYGSNNTGEELPKECPNKEMGIRKFKE